MKYIFFTAVVFLLLTNKVDCQNSICLTNQNTAAKVNIDAKSINDLKIVRINYHFMLKSDGTGNFSETGDGIGNSYNGYQYAQELTDWMNGRASWNSQLNIPSGNSISVIAKNYRYVLDAVYFHRNDATYNFQTINYNTQGEDKDSVLNIFLTFDVNGSGSGGYASNLSPNSKNKHTENRHYWESYVETIQNGSPMGWLFHGAGSNLNHELCHLMSLSHTVKWNGGGACGTGCSNLTSPQGANTSINMNCDDGCSDTPTAWEITQANNCTKHPDCGWGTGSTIDCSNNVMDYSGDNALSPCQINRIHASLEGGMHTYLLCTAVQTDQSYTDIGYPRISYYGRNVDIGDNSAATADVTDDEQLTVYFSESVELRNFEIKASDADFEVKFNGTCTF